MTPHIPEECSTRLIDWSPFVIMDDTMPPRDPDEDEEDGGRRGRRGERTTPTNRRSCASRTKTSSTDYSTTALCRFVTHAGNARPFPLCSLEVMIVAAAEAYAGFRVGDDR